MSDKNEYMNDTNENKGISAIDKGTANNPEKREKRDSLITIVKQLASLELRNSGFTYSDITAILNVSTRTMARYRENIENNRDTLARLLPYLKKWEIVDFKWDRNVLMADIIKRMLQCQEKYNGELTKTDTKNLLKILQRLEQPKAVNEETLKDIILLYIEKAVTHLAESDDHELNIMACRFKDRLLKEVQIEMKATPLRIAEAEAQLRKKTSY